MAILKEYGLPEITLDKYDFFWTIPRRTKLWSPSRWSIRALRGNGLEKLIPVKWAFNSKPDIMIVSNSIVLLIEVKFESGEGHDRESGYQQFEVQELISILVRMLRPDYQDMKFINTSLEVNAEMGLSWSEVLPFIEQSDVDDFSKLCMSQLQRF